MSSTESEVPVSTMKLDTPEFRNLFTPELSQLREVFQQNNYELRLAGGPVRDLLLQKQPDDLDFATNATPVQMVEMFNREGIRMLNKKGEEHGTVTARINNKINYEITTLRIDKVWRGLYTTTSMAGKDLAQRKVAFVGNAEARICEDYLRILRYFRFYGRIAQEPNAHCQKTLQAIREHSAGLAQISGERIWIELKKILTGNHSASLIETMHDIELFPYIGLPPAASISTFRRVWERSRGLKPNPMTSLVSLIQTEEEFMRMHDRLKLSGEERTNGLFVLAHRKDKEHSNPLKPYKDLILLGNVKNSRQYVMEVLKYRGDHQLLDRLQNWEPPRFPISGKDLLNLGVPKGKRLGYILKSLKDNWIESDYEQSKEDLLKLVPQLQTDPAK
ncbi:putative CCA tRNA nucleotidyltransferase 1, mitochondrial [Apostichopus japonicus]|uniref:Putative CCA tRNA nucleotidyltransferase 1, mitochondrial n=1 Tax=Stichopus japonicus TaxID=307972 RepID=A0A2G8KY35_STIJA|nr:putative CCA tRNA nucleotidyltransferase 1, mitochondrial [Apostichopus japonicus]